MTISIRNALILSKKKISIPFSRQRLEWRKCARGIFSFQLFQFLFSAIQTPRVTWKRKFYIYNNYNYYIYKVYFTLISTHAQHRFQINWKLKSEIGERRLGDDVLSKYPIMDKLGRQQRALFVNEDGLYDTILESRTPLEFLYFSTKKEKQTTFQVICLHCILRKLGDSNPRYGCPYVSLANWWFQPLTQTSFPHLFSNAVQKYNIFRIYKGITPYFFKKNANILLSQRSFL